VPSWCPPSSYGPDARGFERHSPVVPGWSGEGFSNLYDWPDDETVSTSLKVKIPVTLNPDCEAWVAAGFAVDLI
jgi:hypothetical protein